MKVDLLDSPKEDVRLEIIPMIDVIFCILTFFILAAVGLTRQQAISLDLPSAQTGQPLPGQMGSMGDRLYVSVDDLGQVYLDQQPVSIDLLYDVLLQFSQVNPNGLMVLYAARDARYEDVVGVLDILRSVGGERVALATLPRDIDLSDPNANTFPFPDALPQGVPGAPSLGDPGANPLGDPDGLTNPAMPLNPSNPSLSAPLSPSERFPLAPGSGSPSPSQPLPSDGPIAD
ncbi:biopolymer transporter ExbD [Leptolyngbya sp. BL0902]|uniref:ExbD/TolR family protein n=1 Tax=Leptolyngbya sp. BL0902 TaxID=1115757 RepID=UPI0018E70B54|nr:biopolymer transporter ExbD [Leptolyngbya sp. BL0902]QQE66203.1 biopolymer transporter ExbD [Leptolyngbya sp. BL0902]